MIIVGNFVMSLRSVLRSRFRSGSFVIAPICALALAGCGGSGGNGVPDPLSSSTAATSYAGPLASATLTLTVSQPSQTASSTRKPQYVSSATTSVVVNLNSASGLTTAQINSFNATAALTTFNLSNCTQSGATYTCSGFHVPAGSDVFTFKAYSGTNGTGSILSENVTPSQTIVAGSANSITVMLDASAATIAVSGTGACASGVVGSNFGSVGTTPVTFNVAFTDPAGRPISGSTGLPTIGILDNTNTVRTTSGTINGTNGTVAFTINQSAQSFTLTPSTSTVTNASVVVHGTQPNSNGVSDGLSYNLTQMFTFSTGIAPGPSFLAAVEQLSGTSGQIHLYHLTVGGTGATDIFTPLSPSPTLADQNSDVDNPQSLLFDSNGDLLIANGGQAGANGDFGNFACVPAGAIASGVNAATVLTNDLDDPSGIAYDSRDNHVVLSNTVVSAPDQFSEFALNGTYAFTFADPETGLGSFGVTNVPALAAGTFAVALTNGTETDPMHASSPGTSEIALVTAGNTQTTIIDGGSPNYSIDIPHAIAYDPHNNQLAIANFSGFHKLLSFYSLGPATLQKTVNTGHRNYIVASSANGTIAVGGTDSAGTGLPVVNIYDNTSSRNLVGAIPFDTYTTSAACTSGSGPNTYGSSVVITSLAWLNNTKLLIGVQSNQAASNGLYVFDTTPSTYVAPSGYDPSTCATDPAGPLNTSMLRFTGKPLGTAYQP